MSLIVACWDVYLYRYLWQNKLIEDTRIYMNPNININVAIELCLKKHNYNTYSSIRNGRHPLSHIFARLDITPEMVIKIICSGLFTIEDISNSAIYLASNPRFTYNFISRYFNITRTMMVQKFGSGMCKMSLFAEICYQFVNLNPNITLDLFLEHTELAKYAKTCPMLTWDFVITNNHLPWNMESLLFYNKCVPLDIVIDAILAKSIDIPERDDIPFNFIIDFINLESNIDIKLNFEYFYKTYDSQITLHILEKKIIQNASKFYRINYGDANIMWSHIHILSCITVPFLVKITSVNSKMYNINCGKLNKRFKLPLVLIKRKTDYFGSLHDDYDYCRDEVISASITNIYEMYDFKYEREQFNIHYNYLSRYINPGLTHKTISYCNLQIYENDAKY